MTESNSQEKFETAVELSLLDDEQLEAIRLEQQSTNSPAFEIAIRRGFLNGKQLELIDVLADPLSVVPGYRIDGLLGQGGVGTVYKATQLRLERSVAIKTINRSTARSDFTPKRFEREAKIIGRLRHPNIVSAFDFGVHNQQLYLVMEFIDGIDASNLLKKEGRLPELHAWHIARQVCNALDNAKQHEVIHRDIKPANLILTTPPAGVKLPRSVPFVKVADFGLAKFNDQQLDATITLEHAVNGTPFYMSPEQIKAKKLDHRSDIYSLGTTIWHLITGEPPISGAGPLDVITSKIKLEDDWLSEAPDRISNAGFKLLKKMCFHKREQRIDDYTYLNSEIESVIQQLGDRPLGDTGEFELAGDIFSAPANVITMQDLTKTFADQEGIQAAQELRHSEHLDPTPSASKQKWMARIAWLLGLATMFMLVSSLVLPSVLFPKGSSDSIHGTKSAGNIENDSTDESSFDRLREFDGPIVILFNGLDIDPTQKNTGTWEPARGAEGGAILSGLGTRNFRCCENHKVPLKNFLFVCGFRHNAADQIGYRLLDESESAIWEVIIAKDKAILKNGEEVSKCPIQQFDEEKNLGYHQFRIECQPDHWRIEINDELLGEIPRPDTDFGELTVQLFVTGAGPAHFEQIHFRSFKSN